MSDAVPSVVAERVEHYLRAKGAVFEIRQHPPAASAAEYSKIVGTRLQQQVKALFVRLQGSAKDKPFVIVALAADKKADLARVRDLMGASNAQLGSKDDLLRETGCRFGELPPLGGLFGLPLLLDKDLQSEDAVYFNAGTLTASAVMASRELVRIETPIPY